MQDFEGAARRILPGFLFHYIAGGAGAEGTLRDNLNDLAAVRLRQRVLADVADISLSVNLFGQDLAMPVLLGPVGLSGLYARRGEVQAARAARNIGVPFCLSTVSVCPIEEVVAGSGGAPWFQLYMLKDRGFMRDLLQRAKAAECPVLLFTIDMPVPGRRNRDAHSGISGPRAAVRRIAQSMSRPRWAWDVGLWGRPHQLGNVAPVLGGSSGLNDFIGWLAANFEPGITWRDLDWLRSEWPGPIILKGVLEVDDAREAASWGANGIVVSNHGGRQLDRAPSSVHALPAIADAVGDRLTVLVDSGVRSGADIVRMMGLGAKAVLLGRAWAYALAADGERGVLSMLRLLEAELRVTMALCGAREAARLDRAVIA